MGCSPTPQPEQEKEKDKPDTPVVPDKPDQPDTPTPDPEYTFSADPATLTFPSEGGSLRLQLVTAADWKASTREEWIDFSPAAEQRDQEVTVTVLPYTDTEYDRRGSILFEVDGKGKGSVEVTIIQLHHEGQEVPPVPGPDVKVYTVSASNITTTSANITCNYSGAPEGGVYDRGVFYGTKPGNLEAVAAINSSSSQSGYFTVVLSSLEPGTTYYYKAYVTVWDESSSRYVDVCGEVKSFVTETGQPVTVQGIQYLHCYEMPSIALVSEEACSNTGGESFGNTNWFNYETTNPDQMVITHTFADGSKIRRNWTALIDRSKKAPLWSAFVMHDDAYPDNNVGRTGSWTPDPGIPQSWQSCFSSSGYSRGHFVASNYRQSTGVANKQTFYYTNQALQYQDGFNSGVWSSLEQAVVDHAPSGRDTLYVTVGVLYEKDETANGIPVPSHFYKCLMQCSFSSSGEMTDARGVAYLFTNEPHKNMTYSQAATTIDAVEERSGFDFFAKVPAALQEKAEKMSSGLW